MGLAAARRYSKKRKEKGKKTGSYITPEEPLQEATLGWVGELLPVQIRGSGAIWSKDVEILKAFCLDHLDKKKKIRMVGKHNKILKTAGQNGHLGQPTPSSMCLLTSRGFANEFS